MKKNNHYPSVDDIQIIDTRGEWPTKSDGVLSVLYKIDYLTLTKFLTYDQLELDKISVDIRGLRSYVVSGLAKGKIGANEWHRVRNEIAYCISGSLRWTCKDPYGDTREYTLDKNTAIITPHHILHTYEVLEDNSAISVTTNTLFDPNQPETFDTYTANSFTLLNPTL